MTDQVELDYERNVNRDYQRRIDIHEEQMQSLELEILRERNTLWSNGFRRSDTGNLSRLISGRVALAEESDGLPASFYVGPVHVQTEELLVVSFAAPVASLFFRGRQSSDRASTLVEGRRSFVGNNDDIIDYSDDIEGGRTPGEVFRRTEGASTVLEVPKAPVRAVRPTIDVPVRENATDGDAGALERLDGLRGKDAVIAALLAPRTGEQGSLLGTLQEDQYDIVSRDPRLPVIVQGNPGAGKTVIAVHRAAYLTHPGHDAGDRPGQGLPLSHVGVIGPTSEYVDLILSVPGRIGGGSVTVMSVDGLLAKLAGFTAGDSVDVAEAHESTVSTSESFAIALERVVDRFKEEWEGTWTLEILVGQLVGDNEAAEEYFVEANPEEGGRFADYLRQFSSFSDAKRHRQNMGWLAVVGIALGTAPQLDFDHLIVDEAQDLSPLVWHVLRSILRPGGGMSVFGDIYQRRNDFSWPTWSEVARSVPLGRPVDSDGLSDQDLATRSNFPVVELEVGYRSTVEIQEYANRILPRGERAVTALRHGPRPRVSRLKSTNMVGGVADRIEVIVEDFPDGVSAVIAPTQDLIQGIGDELRRRGWRIKAGTRERTFNNRRVALLLPDQARGLEFDGVVVVEPSRFPQQDGGLRVLYTSLTRANRVLEVVHSQALPRGLR